MRWRQGRRSTNVEDRRGRRMTAARGISLGGGGLLLVIIFALVTGEDPSRLLDILNQGDGSVRLDTETSGPPPSAADQERADFVKVVLADTEDTWAQLFQQAGSAYQPPALVMFSDFAESACGFNSAAVGPFYCPGDHRVYIDLSFFDTLQRRFGAPGEFAQAYVIAHEVGHHVQNLMGVSGQVQNARSRASQGQANALSVRQELQADCFAGVWAHHADRQRDLLEAGDIEDGLNAAAAIGDDRLQRESRGYVQPESWTHGSSEQRVRWFKRGLEEGRVDRCNTFESDVP